MRALRDLQQAVRAADVCRADALLRLHPEMAKAEGLLHLAVTAPRALAPLGPARPHAGDADRREIVRLLLAHGASADARDANGETPLFRATAAGDGALAELLLGRSADPNAANRAGETPLHRAVRNRRLALLPTLLSFEADLEAKDRKGLTPLQVAHDDDMETVSDIFSRYEGARRYIGSFAADPFAARNDYTPEVRTGARFAPTLVTTGAFAF